MEGDRGRATHKDTNLCPGQPPTPIPRAMTVHCRVDVPVTHFVFCHQVVMVLLEHGQIFSCFLDGFGSLGLQQWQIVNQNRGVLKSNKATGDSKNKKKPHRIHPVTQKWPPPPLLKMSSSLRDCYISDTYSDCYILDVAQAGL